MATKTEMVTFILENSNEFEITELENLSYKKIKKVYDDTDLKEENVIPPIDDITLGDPNLPESVMSGNIIENEGMVNNDFDQDEIEEVVEDTVEETVEVEWDYNKLSPVDKKHYRRTGIKRITKVRKYTRFIGEKPKI